MVTNGYGVQDLFLFVGVVYMVLARSRSRSISEKVAKSIAWKKILGKQHSEGLDSIAYCN